MKLKLDQANATHEGDYIQAVFETEDENGPYLLVQRQFEDPNDEYCYIETHDDDYSGHARIRRARLHRNIFTIELLRKSFAHIEVTFNAEPLEFDELRRVLQTMIPTLELGTDIERVLE